ncbi:hypothetical protein BU25DRAFT_95785 [Macroventuria anomochaeta]|uniref:Uncharacterized protein n=1 Tax=Macroventuria anomochaeta TaxID=301207 RepID=A0ACB6RWC4_9PLEO|nr:uncharacterized protein BU25DRAFT_95785 [Macroventuria anomochaeta]KAF2626315.1 hypothetical protein BU25DRAFT_95785 [Macroventuria anomochaeta]
MELRKLTTTHTHTHISSLLSLSFSSLHSHVQSLLPFLIHFHFTFLPSALLQRCFGRHSRCSTLACTCGRQKHQAGCHHGGRVWGVSYDLIGIVSCP